jgi:hypothetical protein
MVLSLSSDSDSSSASQEITLILWNPKVHYRIHNSPTIVSILSQINPFYFLPSYFFKFHFNIVFPSTFSYSNPSLSLGFPTNILCTYIRTFPPVLTHASPTRVFVPVIEDIFFNQFFLSASNLY